MGPQIKNIETGNAAHEKSCIKSFAASEREVTLTSEKDPHHVVVMLSRLPRFGLGNVCGVNFREIISATLSVAFNMIFFVCLFLVYTLTL